MAGIDGAGYCATNHFGPLCETCPDQQYFDGDLACVACPDAGDFVGILIGVLFAIAVVLLATRSFVLRFELVRKYSQLGVLVAKQFGLVPKL